MKLVAYARVSTERQAERGLGLDVQERQIRERARVRKHRIVRWYRDEGVSGSNGLESRVALADALDAVRDHTAGGIVVARLDRLARDLVIQEQLLAEIRRLGGDLYSTSDGEGAYLADDPDDPSRRLIRQVLGAVAEYDKAMIALRLRAGRRRKAEHGGFAYGAPTFGYRSEAGSLVPEPEEQTVIERGRELTLAGKSTRQVAQVLDAEEHRAKRGGSWHPATVGRIVRRLELRGKNYGR